jgi:DMSO/TMAO reductase YedYZ molybdopterin-dependent catalytic subunit
LNRIEKVIIVFIFIFFFSYATNAFFNNNYTSYVEIREYEGKNLSSISDFRENSIKGPQYIEKESYNLLIFGLTDKDLSYTYDEVVNDHVNYKKIVTLYCVEGWDVTILWEGVLVKDLLWEAGLSLNNTMDQYVVIFYAYDGYTTSLTLRYLIENDIIIAHKMNNSTLPPERGFPFQLVAESKWGYKWIKWITKIEVSKDINYKGYWESRGYTNTGDL